MSYNPMLKEDTYSLLRAAQEGDEEAKEQLIASNTGLVKNIALKFASSSYELDDLLQIGFIGLLKAIEKFDEKFDVMFSTYAVPMILGEIKRYLRDDGRIKMGRQIKQDMKLMGHMQEEYYNLHGRYPKISELAAMMNCSPENIINLMEAKDALHNLESLDDPDRVEKQGIELATETEESHVNMIQLKSIISSLQEKERQIIVLRYFKDKTQQDIANQLGISQVQVSRIEKKVLENMRKNLE